MCSEDATEGSQTVLSALVATAFALANSLNSIYQLLPLELGCVLVEVVTCEEFVYGVDAAGSLVLRRQET